ncbi:pyrin domain-containing protein 1-like isoform 1-T2 [Polymixia lowei]
MKMNRALLKTLQNLGGEELKQFQWYLCQPEVLPDFPAIPKFLLEKADRQDTVSQMVQTYGDDRAVLITLKVLEEISRNDLVQSLTNTVPGLSDHLASQR